MDLRQLLAELSNDPAEEGVPARIKAGQAALNMSETRLDALISTLKDWADDVDAAIRQPQFKVGDIITPKKGSNLAYRGSPWVVVETFFNAPIRSIYDATSAQSEFACRIDMRTMVIIEDRIMMFANESFMFEPFDRDKYLSGGYK